MLHSLIAGKLVESTGCAIDPYNKFPMLLEILTGFLKHEQSHSLRRETMRVLGLLGALDPYVHKINMGVIETGSDASSPVVGQPEPVATADGAQVCSETVNFKGGGFMLQSIGGVVD